MLTHSAACQLERIYSLTERRIETADICTICTIQTIGQQLNPTDAGVLAKESHKYPIISAVSRYVREGWSQNIMSDQI